MRTEVLQNASVNGLLIWEAIYYMEMKLLKSHLVAQTSKTVLFIRKELNFHMLCL